MTDSAATAHSRSDRPSAKPRRRRSAAAASRAPAHAATRTGDAPEGNASRDEPTLDLFGGHAFEAADARPVVARRAAAAEADADAVIDAPADRQATLDGFDLPDGHDRAKGDEAESASADQRVAKVNGTDGLAQSEIEAVNGSGIADEALTDTADDTAAESTRQVLAADAVVETAGKTTAGDAEAKTAVEVETGEGLAKAGAGDGSVVPAASEGRESLHGVVVTGNAPVDAPSATPSAGLDAPLRALSDRIAAMQAETAALRRAGDREMRRVNRLLLALAVVVLIGLVALVLQTVQLSRLKQDVAAQQQRIDRLVADQSAQQATLMTLEQHNEALVAQVDRLERHAARQTASMKRVRRGR